MGATITPFSGQHPSKDSIRPVTLLTKMCFFHTLSRDDAAYPDRLVGEVRLFNSADGSYGVDFGGGRTLFFPAAAGNGGGASDWEPNTVEPAAGRGQ